MQTIDCINLGVTSNASLNLPKTQHCNIFLLHRRSLHQLFLTFEAQIAEVQHFIWEGKMEWFIKSQTIRKLISAVSSEFSNASISHRALLRHIATLIWNSGKGGFTQEPEIGFRSDQMPITKWANNAIRWHDNVTEWLRWWTRNPLGSARRGSNPLAVAFLVYYIRHGTAVCPAEVVVVITLETGLEPAISSLGGRRLIH